MNRVEILAPAGDLDKLKYAIIYGADAVYLGGQTFGLRAASKNFTIEEMKEGISFAHERNAKVYLTLNIIPHNEDINELEAYLTLLKEVPFDAVILSDPGTLMYVKEHLPEMEIHLSTQANNTNFMSARFWTTQGVSRIVLAREMSLEEIKETVEKTKDLNIEYEVFVHGAMCISYSGRCLLSNYMTSRDANKGDCAQSCRWKYHLVEEKRPGEYYPVVEDEKGTYFFNSKDLCVINHINQVIESGVKSIKIEGRNKSIYYVANIVRAYKAAVDSYYSTPEFSVDDNWLKEIKKASHRQFTTGFYFKKPDENDQLYTTSSYIREYDFIGIVLEYDEVSKIATVEQRNKFSTGEIIEIMGPDFFLAEMKIGELYDENGIKISEAPHAKQIVKLKSEIPLKPYYLLRRERDANNE
ncbi:MAG: U32 family peptidase [Clostridiales bacterium]|nr:U32 family peptidase [Clostridiales bacterium]